jgi:hypothetical protein
MLRSTAESLGGEALAAVAKLLRRPAGTMSAVAMAIVATAGGMRYP